MHTKSQTPIYITLFVTIIAACAAFCVINREPPPILSASEALDLTRSASQGFSFADGETRLYLFVDDDCAVCSTAIEQAATMPVPVKILPIKVYAPARMTGDHRSAIMAANTEVFEAIGRPVMPLWLGLDSCDEPVFFHGTLTPADMGSLAADEELVCPKEPPKTNRPNLGGHPNLVL